MFNNYDYPNGRGAARRDAVVFQAKTVRSAAIGHTLSPHVLEKEKKLRVIDT